MTATLPPFGDVSSRRLAKGWHQVDPESSHRSAVEAALAEGDRWIRDLFHPRVTLDGSAIRAHRGPGPGAMNRVVIRVITAALADQVNAAGGGLLVIGHDTCRYSCELATDIARVAAARRMQTVLIDHVRPDVVLPRAMAHCEAAAGVAITADDAGRSSYVYRIYGPDSAMLSPAAEADLTERITKTSLVREDELARPDDVRIGALESLQRRYGVWLSGQRSIRFEENGPNITQVLNELARTPPPALASARIIADRGQSPLDTVTFVLDDAHVLVCCGESDAALEIRVDASAPPVESSMNLSDSQTATHDRVAQLIDVTADWVADPERRLVELSAEPDISIERRANTLFESAAQSTDRSALELVVRCIDLTTLAGDDTAGRIRSLAARALRPDPANGSVGPTAAVCVYPARVALAAELLAGSPVAVASVAGAFPSGLSSLDVRLADIDDAVAAGADEVDVVINRAALLSGDLKTVQYELASMREHIGTGIMKVIVETGELDTIAAVRAATTTAITAGADFVKTSTGKSKIGATPTAVAAMAETINDHVACGGEPVGIKISGGVRTSANAVGYLAVVESILGRDWLTPARLRFGASGLLANVVSDLYAY